MLINSLKNIFIQYNRIKQKRYGPTTAATTERRRAAPDDDALDVARAREHARSISTRLTSRRRALCRRDRTTGRCFARAPRARGRDVS